MADNRFTHLFIRRPTQVINYTSPKSGGGSIIIPSRNRGRHGSFLKKKFEELWKQSEKEQQNRQAVALPVRTGHYIEFRSRAGFDLITKSLESMKSNIRLLNIREQEIENQYKTEQQSNKKITIATVYVPSNKVSFFLNKIEQYLNQNTKPTKKQLQEDPNFQGNPKNKNLIESIESIRLAVLESFWQDDKELIPENDESVSCEVWLRTDKSSSANNFNERSKEFFNICDELNTSKKSIQKENQIEYRKDQTLSFPERTVVLIKANKNQLVELIKSSDQIAEFRKAKETARFWLEQENKDQVEWVKDLQKRLDVDKESKVSVCLLDTGVNNGHPLIGPVLSDKDCHTVNAEWEIDDKEGHGTTMSGLIIYGDLQKSLESKKQINVRHKLESVKLIPSSGVNNPKELYGHLTKQGINRAEIEKPDRKRTICMAVTSTDDRDKGRPSSWSGAIDQITSGAEEDHKKRLLIVSAGNVEGQTEWNNYPNSNLTNTVHDPAQSWNALTVGAYTDKTLIKDTKLKGYTPIAKKGALSPFSSTSATWERTKWPIKPDIVLEGGNIAKDKTRFSSVSEDLSLLSLHHKPQERHFEMIYATSAATAQASWMASQIQTHYPEIWPETIRALMVHSADWKENMKRQFWNNNDSDKSNYKKILRIFGYGVPDLNKAVSSYKNSLTLVSEQTLRPFKKEKSKSPTTKDMHFYRMPWPKNVLESLPDQTVVRFRFTLSYFIEPGPGEIGWKDRYRYPSFGLRFALMKPSESEGQFRNRINKIAKDEEQNKNVEARLDDRWIFGKKNTNLGSIHSDIWEGTAQEVAHCNFMAIYPSIGWWKERYHLEKWGKKARYSLIVSLSTPETTVDLYTPVATQIGIPIKV